MSGDGAVYARPVAARRGKRKRSSKRVPPPVRIIPSDPAPDAPAGTVRGKVELIEYERDGVKRTRTRLTRAPEHGRYSTAPATDLARELAANLDALIRHGPAAESVHAVLAPVLEAYALAKQQRHARHLAHALARYATVLVYGQCSAAEAIEYAARERGEKTWHTADSVPLTVDELHDAATRKRGPEGGLRARQRRVARVYALLAWGSVADPAPSRELDDREERSPELRALIAGMVAPYERARKTRRNKPS